MDEISRKIGEVIWAEKFWLPPNITWNDMKPSHSKPYPHCQSLLFPLPLAIVIFFVRLLVEKVVWEPCGLRLGISARKSVVLKRHPALEASFRVSSNPKHHDLLLLAKKCDMTERQVARWLRVRSAQKQSQTTQLDKFKETGWRFTFYVGIFIYGIWALWDKPWLWNGEHFWANYPFQTIATEVWWYYMLELGFYWSLLISQFFDVKRKDFWEMFFHHIITICLMCFSWTNNSVRIGTGVLLVHDAADFWLELAKMAKYAKKPHLSEIAFGIFTVVWICTRLFLYPYRILRFTLPCPLGDECFPAFHLYNVLLVALQILHIFWTCTIFRVIYRALNTGKTEDVRSETESSEDEQIHEVFLPETDTQLSAGDAPLTSSVTGLRHRNGDVTHRFTNGW